MEQRGSKQLLRQCRVDAGGAGGGASAGDDERNAAQGGNASRDGVCFSLDAGGGVRHWDVSLDIRVGGGGSSLAGAALCWKRRRRQWRLWIRTLKIVSVRRREKSVKIDWPVKCI